MFFGGGLSCPVFAAGPQIWASLPSSYRRPMNYAQSGKRFGSETSDLIGQHESPLRSSALPIMIRSVIRPISYYYYHLSMIIFDDTTAIDDA